MFNLLLFSVSCRSVDSAVPRDLLAQDVFRPTPFSDSAEKTVNERVAAARHKEAAAKCAPISKVDYLLLYHLLPTPAPCSNSNLSLSLLFSTEKAPIRSRTGIPSLRRHLLRQTLIGLEGQAVKVQNVRSRSFVFRRETEPCGRKHWRDKRYSRGSTTV